MSSVISPAPEIRLISSSFLLMAIAVLVEELAFFAWDEAEASGSGFWLDFINKGYGDNVHILYFMRSEPKINRLTIFVKGCNQIMGDHLGRSAFNMVALNHMY